MYFGLLLIIPSIASITPLVAPASFGERTVNDGLIPRVSDPAKQKVTSSLAFTTGAGNKDNANINDGTGNGGSDVYNCYLGGPSGFPDSSEWAEFDDLWNNSLNVMFQSCENNPSTGSGDTREQAGQIWNAIQQVAEASLVDHRFILAIIMQESQGCVNIITTPNPDGVDNPGLMQTAGGVSFVGNDASVDAQQASIKQMVTDGTQGTEFGDGLVQCINQYGDIYSAARCYNSGSVDSLDLNNVENATASYVMDVANRMTGWVLAPDRFSECYNG